MQTTFECDYSKTKKEKAHQKGVNKKLPPYIKTII